MQRRRRNRRYRRNNEGLYDRTRNLHDDREFYERTHYGPGPRFRFDNPRHLSRAGQRSREFEYYEREYPEQEETRLGNAWDRFTDHGDLDFEREYERDILEREYGHGSRAGFGYSRYRSDDYMDHPYTTLEDKERREAMKDDHAYRRYLEGRGSGEERHWRRRPRAARNRRSHSRRARRAI